MFCCLTPCPTHLWRNRKKRGRILRKNIITIKSFKVAKQQHNQGQKVLYQMGSLTILWGIGFILWLKRGRRLLVASGTPQLNVGLQSKICLSLR
jgi:hypothetical protein